MIPSLVEPSLRVTRLPVAAALAGLCAVSTAVAQDAPATNSGRALVVVPTLSVSETITNNAELNDAAKRSDSITTVSAGINVIGNGRRVRGSLDYQLTGSVYARDHEANQTTNALSAALSSELIDNFLFLDANATVGQQAVSAFGAQSRSVSADTGNRSEVRNYSIRPSARGQVGGLFSYNAVLTHAQQSNAGGSVGDSTTESATVILNSLRTVPLGWTVVGSRQSYDFTAGRRSTVDSLRGTLRYQLHPEFRVSLNGGKERTDVLSDAGSNRATWGVGADWIPNERTRLAVQRDNRFFGTGHSISFDYRLPRMTLRFGSSRDVSAPQQGYANAGAISLYDLLNANLSAVQPDPVLRQLLIQQELARLGLSANTPVSLGFLTSAVTLVNRQDLAVAFQGLRSTLTFSYYRSDSRRIDQTVNPPDDFANASRVLQRGLNVALNYRLTGSSGVSLAYNQDRNRGSQASQATDLQSLTLTWTRQLGPRMSVVAGARHVEFEGSSLPYSESAAFASWSVRF